jgi:hydrogenase maturation protease
MSGGRVAVVGAGNLLLSDEGVGVHVVEALNKEYVPPFVTVVDAGTALVDVLGSLRGYERILLVDALRAGGSPGSLYRFELGQLRERAAKGQLVMSLHQTGLLQAVGLARLRGLDPKCITVIGVEPERLQPGIELSETVSRRVPDVCHLVMEEIRSLLTV